MANIVLTQSPVSHMLTALLGQNEKRFKSLGLFDNNDCINEGVGRESALNLC